MAAERFDFAELYRRLDRAERALSGEGLDAAHRARVLAERAKAIAAAPEEARTDHVAVFAFVVAGERYALPIDQVDQVLEVSALTPVPGAPRHVLGVVLARSKAVLVLDLRQLLGLEGGMSDLTRALLVGREDGRFALAAETVEGRVELARADLGPPPAGPFLAVTPDRLALLDLERLGTTHAAGEPG